MGFPSSGTFAVLHLVYRSRVTQDRHHSSPEREAGRDRLRSDGYGTEATVILEKTRGEFGVLSAWSWPSKIGMRSASAGGTAVMSSYRQ